MEGQSRRNWNNGQIEAREDMPGKSFTEWNGTRSAKLA